MDKIEQIMAVPYENFEVPVGVPTLEPKYL